MSLPPLSDVVQLAPTHEVGAFCCGNKTIDDYLKNRARTEQIQQLNQVYVVAGADDRVLAYFTLSPLTVRVQPELLARLRIDDVQYPSIGGFLLGRLGVDRTIAKQGVGASLVMSAARIARAEASNVGGAFLAVDAKDDGLVAWYERLGFRRLDTRARRIILPLGNIP